MPVHLPPFVCGFIPPCSYLPIVCQAEGVAEGRLKNGTSRYGFSTASIVTFALSGRAVKASSPCSIRPK